MNNNIGSCATCGENLTSDHKCSIVHVPEKLPDDILAAVNVLNRNKIIGLRHLQPISYDGLNCPKCGHKTVHSSGFSWCPQIACDYGVELSIGAVITKWA